MRNNKIELNMPKYVLVLSLKVGRTISTFLNFKYKIAWNVVYYKQFLYTLAYIVRKYALPEIKKARNADDILY